MSLCLLLTACASLGYKGATIHVPPADSKVTKREVESVVTVVGRAAYERGWAVMEPSPADRRDETGFIAQYGVSAGPGGARHSGLVVSVWVPEDRSEMRVRIADWEGSPKQLNALRDEIRQELEVQFPGRQLTVTEDDLGLWAP
jgi:hypothetical protein